MLAAPAVGEWSLRGIRGVTDRRSEKVPWSWTTEAKTLINKSSSWFVKHKVVFSESQDGLVLTLPLYREEEWSKLLSNNHLTGFTSDKLRVITWTMHEIIFNLLRSDTAKAYTFWDLWSLQEQITPKNDKYNTLCMSEWLKKDAIL